MNNCQNTVCYCTGQCMIQPSPWDYPWTSPETVGPDVLPGTWTTSYPITTDGTYVITDGSTFLVEYDDKANDWSIDIEDATVFTEAEAYKRLLEYVRAVSLPTTDSIYVAEIVEETTTVRRLVE